MADLGLVPVHGQRAHEPVHAVLRSLLRLNEDREDVALSTSVGVGVELCPTRRVAEDDAEVLCALVAATGLDVDLDLGRLLVVLEDQGAVQLNEVLPGQGPVALGLVLARDLAGAPILSLHSNVHLEVVDLLPDVHGVLREADHAGKVVVDDDDRGGLVVSKQQLLLGGVGGKSGVVEVNVELLVVLVGNVVDNLDGDQLLFFAGAKLQGPLHVDVILHGFCLPVARDVLDRARHVQVPVSHNSALHCAGVLQNGIGWSRKLDNRLWLR
mmetsp:Transcript_114989/g.305736  ORF Transcript_114989/g.305736 Transcript_114989/m.305736 type:complete len:269 (+) Transcript_114989:541-1347(+)